MREELFEFGTKVMINNLECIYVGWGEGGNKFRYLNGHDWEYGMILTYTNAELSNMTIKEIKMVEVKKEIKIC